VVPFGTSDPLGPYGRERAVCQTVRPDPHPPPLMASVYDRTYSAPMPRAVVIYESFTGNTARAARLIGEAVAAEGVDVSIYPITDIGLKELSAADIVFVGTWVDGLVLFGHRPGRAGRIRKMPVIDGKRVAAFMTYAIHAGKALDRFADVLSERGASVVARRLLRRDRLESDMDGFVRDALANVPA
jgi:Flavodoxin domain